MKSLKTKKTYTPFGTLYHHSMRKTHGSAIITPAPLTKRKKFSRTVGAGLTSVAMALYIYSFGSILKTSSDFQTTKDTVQVQTVSAQETNVQMENITETDTIFSIYIPFLQAKSVVYENVDPSNEDAYGQALKEGVAQAKGTGLPGEGKRIFLFAHSTNSILNIQKYNAIFYDLSKVPNGEIVELYYHRKVYQYRVTGQQVVSASDVSWLEPHDGEELVLQTCWPPGTSWKRLLLFAKPL